MFSAKVLAILKIYLLLYDFNKRCVRSIVEVAKSKKVAKSKNILHFECDRLRD